MVCIWLILIVGFDCLGKISADPDWRRTEFRTRLNRSDADEKQNPFEKIERADSRHPPYLNQA